MITITISGPGGCMEYELETIKRALIGAGINLHIINPYPWVDSPDKMPHEEYMKKRREDLLSGQQLVDAIKNDRTTIIVEHMPWGG
jgi:hypothetical protein